MALMGLLKMTLALLFGPSLLTAFEAFPSTVLGVLLTLTPTLTPTLTLTRCSACCWA